MTDSIRAEPSDDLGANAWVVDEMRDLWAADPASVDEAWRALFEGETPDSPAGKAGPPAAATASRTTIDTTATDVTAPAAPAESGAPTRTSAAEAAPPDAGRQPRPRSPKAQPDDDALIGEPIKGVGARIVSNMEASLAVPTATSFREVPAKLLEVNRKIINGHLGRKMVRKISFTHLIGYAVVRAITDTVPAMNNIYITDAAGKPRIVRPDHIGLGIAVDIARDDGTRSLMVPCIRDADTLDFAEFVDRYDEQIAKIRENRLTADDMRGVTVTITNPGTIGTQQSVPRLMTGQGTIVGVGALAFPTEYEAADPSLLADLGVSKLVTISSTYDHRVIQGAESGLFLQRVHDLLLGTDGFYDSAFRALHIPYSAVEWRRDFNPVDREAAMLEKQAKVNQLINQYRVRGHLIADLNPLRDEAPQMHAELDPATYGLTIWDLDREFLTGSATGIYATVGGTRRMKLGDLLGVLRDAYCRTVGVEYMHIQ
ncbi:MAG: multifunctional oxoglutarate decarboxylase/oxoglutarate dehydrogenase thiamine pyrophosphate-binding subunit/dihydrolipoyllysine-residue succinyltransferase subunit, partial [Acidimicrobiaceae bacterium]|nr:multifunctional oxoglutarate decarboxylase/oxoglutarate dehydrogenase thiamine pyrophosphate-binding subunit/dihydrolipoyllysine-residue succinyltransferase subunit [Acidimicrobiaceae bacterium]